MKVDGKHYRSIWFDAGKVHIIDQRWLPHQFESVTLETLDAFSIAIRDMWVRGAPLIGATAAYGVAVSMGIDPSEDGLDETLRTLGATRPTAVNLRWALSRCEKALRPLAPMDRHAAGIALAHEIAEEDVEINRQIGSHGVGILREIARQKSGPVNILTHCNAGWPATVDWGTATSPIYHGAEEGLDLHVWVDETRPRNQGALTAWELGKHGIPHTYVTDNAGGHLIQRGQVDVVITGTDRTASNGDVANKIGTYLKALAAKDAGVPFYVALPSPTIDWTLSSGMEIPIEDRPADEISHVLGLQNSAVASLQVTPHGTPVANPAFDVTPARLVTGLITERGICEASEMGLKTLFPEMGGR